MLRSIRLLLEPSDTDETGRKRLGSWSQSYSGAMYWILDPVPEEVHLVDIVVGLVNASRYRGQTMFFYSVLTHCILVSRAVEKLALERGWSKEDAQEAALEGLMHDASEAYLGDVARPLKRSKEMRGYCKVEALWEDVIRTRFRIRSSPESAKLVKECDNRVVLDEIHTFMRDPDMWKRNGRYLDLKPLGVEVPNWTKEQTMNEFYKRFDEVTK
jgi:5'-deoxynucleotidase YfbR-like HD superfamily hydrolase